MAFSDQFPKLAAPAGGASQAVGKRRFHEVKRLVRSPTAVFPVHSFPVLCGLQELPSGFLEWSHFHDFTTTTLIQLSTPLSADSAKIPIP